MIELSHNRPENELWTDLNSVSLRCSSPEFFSSFPCVVTTSTSCLYRDITEDVIIQLQVIFVNNPRIIGMFIRK